MARGGRIASLILAAGRSSRFGSSRFAGKPHPDPAGMCRGSSRFRPCLGSPAPTRQHGAALLKQLARIGGLNLVDLAVARSMEAGLDPIVVLGYKWRTIKKALRSLTPPFLHGEKPAERAGRTRVVVNTRYDDGQLSSLKCALRRLSPARYAAFLIYPCDYAAVKSADIIRLAARFRSGANKDIISPSYRGRMGHPVLVSMALKHEFMSLGRRSSARDVIYKDPRRIGMISVNSRRIFMDIDDLTGYHRMQKKYA